MHFKGILVLPMLLLCLLSLNAIAGCAFSPTADYPANSIKKMTVPLATSAISVPPGTEVGATIYRQRIAITSAADKFRISCENAGFFEYQHGYKTLPLEETSTGSKIYKTGVDGIGIAFTSSDNVKFPLTTPTSTCQNSTSCRLAGIWSANTYFELVKTADTVTGGTISAAILPTALYSFGPDSRAVGIYEINISGSLTVNVPTCDVAPASKSMVVQMGSHKVSEFSGQYTGTDWKKVIINLSNCGVFYGKSPTSLATFDGTSNTDVVGLTRNRAKISFSFYETPINPTEGIMAIDSSQYSASGIGIQLSWKEDTSGKINLNSPLAYNLNIGGAQTISLAFYARYIQTTASAPLPGKANGKLEFVMSYE